MLVQRLAPSARVHVVRAAGNAWLAGGGNKEMGGPWLGQGQCANCKAAGASSARGRELHGRATAHGAVLAEKLGCMVLGCWRRLAPGGRGAPIQHYGTAWEQKSGGMRGVLCVLDCTSLAGRACVCWKRVLLVMAKGKRGN